MDLLYENLIDCYTHERYNRDKTSRIMYLPCNFSHLLNSDTIQFYVVRFGKSLSTSRNNDIYIDFE